MINISIVIPVYNSGEILFELNKQMADALKEYNYELILINDCSPDNSWNIIKQLSEKYPNTIGINLRKNSGQDNAIMAGLNYCSGDYVVIMDDDLQHSPYDIPKLVNQCKNGFDVCYAKFKHKKQKWWKNLGSWFNGKVAEIIINKPKGIYLSPFEAINKDVVNEVIKYKGAYPYVQGLILRCTSNVTQRDVEHHNRFSGRSNFNFIRSLTVFLKLATSFSVVPLRIATFIGFISSVIGFLLIPYYLYLFFFTKEIIEGWTTLVVLILLLGGLVLLSLGIIGEYIGRMYLSINVKPQYVIKEITKN